MQPTALLERYLYKDATYFIARVLKLDRNEVK